MNKQTDVGDLADYPYMSTGHLPPVQGRSPIGENYPHIEWGWSALNRNRAARSQ